MKNLCRILSFFIVLVMITSSMPFAFAASSEDVVIKTAVSNISGITGCTISGSRIISTSSAPSAVFALDPRFASAEKLPDVITAVYQVSETNSSSAAAMGIELILNGKTVYRTSLFYTRGYKYYSTSADISGYDGYADHIRITFFTECTSGDTMYLDSIILSSTESAAQSAKNEVINANPTIAEYTEEALTSSAYELDKYMIPYWDTDIIYNEGVYPLLNANGTISPITLMYDVDKIISVRSSSLKTEYKEGVDYIVENGKLKILTTGSIPCVKYREHYYTSSASYTYPMLSGGYVRFQEGPSIPSVQLAVTYTVAKDSKWTGFVPSNQGESLPGTRSKLENGENLKIVFFGDSITNGGNSSAEINMEPFAEAWTFQLEKELKNTYPSAKISCVNGSVSGGGWPDAVSHVNDCIIANKPDLVILALGTNDYQFQWSCSDTLKRMNTVVDSVKKALPSCEIIIVAPMLSNPECFDRNNLYAYNKGYLEKAENTSGVVLADITSVHDYLLTRKKYTDMSANNLCHLNDCFARVYSQTILRTILPKSAGDTYKNIVKGRLENIVNMNLYFQDEQKQLEEIKLAALEKLSGAKTTDECRSILKEAVDLSRLVSTKEDVIGNTLDYTDLKFTSDAAVNAIKYKNNASAVFDAQEAAAKVTVTTASDPSVTVEYPKDNTLSADEYKYVVLTYKVSESNSTLATETQIFFGTEKNVSFSESASSKISPVNDGSYHSEVIDLSGKSWWSGAILRIRIDPFNSCRVSDTMYIASVSLCKTQGEANEKARVNEMISNGEYLGNASIISFENAESLEHIMGDVAELLIGDADLDGELTLIDIKLIREYLLGYTDFEGNAFICADTDRSGQIDGLDYRNARLINLGILPTETVRISTGADKTFKSDEQCAVVTDKNGEYVTFDFDVIDNAEYFALVYKARGTNKNAEIYFGEDPESSTLKIESYALDEVWDKITVKLPDSYKGGKITVNVSGVELFIDSAGLFETFKYANSFTYERMWDRKSERIYTDNVKIIFTPETMQMITYLHNASAERVSSLNAVKLTVGSGKIDPYAYLDLSSYGLNADEYKYIVYEYMNPLGNSSAGTKAEIFFCAGITKNPTKDRSLVFPVTKDGAYHSKVIDLTQASYWYGNIYGIRLDFFTDASVGDVSYVKSVTFCKTLHDAEIACN